MDEVPEEQFRDYAYELASMLSNGHEDLGNMILSFMAENETVPLGQPVQTNFQPCDFDTERITVDVMIHKPVDNLYEVSYRAVIEPKAVAPAKSRSPLATAGAASLNRSVHGIPGYRGHRPLNWNPAS